MEGEFESRSIHNEIKELFESDQGDREKYSESPTNTNVREIRQRDKQRMFKAHEILERGEVLDPNDLNMLAFIFQHGSTAENYRQALSLASQAVDQGLPPQYSLIPQATDRLMIREQLDKGTPLNQVEQRYGTQTMYDESGKAIIPPLDGKVTMEELKKYGINRE